MNFETTKRIVESKLNEVEVVSANKKTIAADNFKVKLKSSPSIKELKEKFLNENASDDVQASADSGSPENENIGVIKIRSKDHGADSFLNSSGERTVIVKNNDILGAQG